MDFRFERMFYIKWNNFFDNDIFWTDYLISFLNFVEKEKQEMKVSPLKYCYAIRTAVGITFCSREKIANRYNLLPNESSLWVNATRQNECFATDVVQQFNSELIRIY